MTMETRHVLFFSNYCTYCRSVLEKLSNRGTRAMFVLVCVDRRQQQLPNFVDRVPIIYTNDSKVLSDDSVMAFIERLAEQTNVASDDEVVPWTMTVGSGICKSFSFLETSEGVYGPNYSDVNAQHSIYTPNDDKEKNAKQDSLSGQFGNSVSSTTSMSTSMESLMAQRDDDVNRYLPPRPRMADS